MRSAAAAMSVTIRAVWPPWRPGAWERGFGGGRERFLDPGDLSLLILQLLSEKPSYGYELIKSIEERLSGGYAPSPGVVYPTLTLLEERGFAQVVEPSEGGRKTYAITDAGRKELDRQRCAASRDHRADGAHGACIPSGTFAADHACVPQSWRSGAAANVSRRPYARADCEDRRGDRQGGAGDR